MVLWAEKLPQKTWRAEEGVQKAWQAKFTIIETNNRASLTSNIPLSTVITLNQMQFYNFALLYLVLQNFQYCSTNLNFNKIQRALEIVLAGTFLPQGSVLASGDCWQVRRL